METRGAIAGRIHKMYRPNDMICSYTNTDWYVAKEIEQLQIENKKNEELAVQAIQVAEQKVFYKNESKIQANKIIDSLQSFFKKDGRVSKVWLFGSYARNEANQHSDIDLLVRFNKDMRISLFDLADISYLLEQILHIKVDLVEEGYPASFAAESIENEKLLVYEKE